MKHATVKDSAMPHIREIAKLSDADEKQWQDRHNASAAERAEARAIVWELDTRPDSWLDIEARS